MKISRLTSSILTSVFLSSASQAATISPPMWWVGMQESHLQLLIEEEGVGDGTVTTNFPGVVVKGVVPSFNDNTLFVDLEISDDAKPGKVSLTIEKKSGDTITLDYELHARQTGSASRQGFDSKDTIYLLTPDRFSNGDTQNDDVDGYEDALDRENKGGRHGGDIQGIINHLDYLSTMGFSQIWSMPLLENAMDSYSYHGYAITDYYNIDPRYGSNADYKKLSVAAKEQGIGLIMDMVLNHIGGNHPWMNAAPDENWIHHDGEFSATTHIRETMHDIHGTQFDKAAFNDGWFVPSMPDLNQSNPKLATYLIQNAVWWVEYAGLSGIRVDTYSYSDKAFLSAWTHRLMTEYPHLNIVGEEWSVNPVITSYWQQGTLRKDGYQSWLPGVMDFPLQAALVTALNEDEGWGTGLKKLYEVLAGDFIYGDPSKLVIFADNHDMSRIYTQLGHDIDKWKMAMTTILTTRGIPQIFYGTELLMQNPGTEDHGIIRSDFPGGWKGDSSNGFTGQGLTPEQTNAQQFIRNLLQLRQSYPTLFSGEMTHFVPFDGAYVYFRHDAETQQQLMVVLNKGVEKALDLHRFDERLSTFSQIQRVDTEGFATKALGSTLKVPANQATVWLISK